MENLRGIIISKGLTIDEVAKEMDVSTNTLYSWSKKKSHPSVTHFNELSKVLNIGFDELHNRIYKN